MYLDEFLGACFLSLWIYMMWQMPWYVSLPLLAVLCYFYNEGK